MICPFCQSPEPLPTTKTVQKKASVVRYHKCARCGRRCRSLQFLDLKIDTNQKSTRHKASILRTVNSIGL